MLAESVPKRSAVKTKVFHVDPSSGTATLNSVGVDVVVRLGEPGGRERALFLAGPGRACFALNRLWSADDLKAEHGLPGLPKSCYYALGADGKVCAAYAPGDAKRNRAWEALDQCSQDSPGLFSKGAWLCKADYDSRKALASKHAFADTLTHPSDGGVESTGMSFRSKRAGAPQEHMVQGLPVVWTLPAGNLAEKFEDGDECHVDAVGFGALAAAPLNNHKGSSSLNNPRPLLEQDHPDVEAQRIAVARTGALNWAQAKNIEAGLNDDELNEQAGRVYGPDEMIMARAIALKVLRRGMVGDARVALVNALQTTCVDGEGSCTLVSLDMAVVDGQHSSRNYATIHRLFQGDDPAALGLRQGEMERMRAAFEKQALAGRASSDEEWEDFKSFFCSNMKTSVRIKPVVSSDWAREMARIANARRALSLDDLEVSASASMGAFATLASLGAREAGSDLRVALAKTLSSTYEFGSNPEMSVSLGSLWKPLAALLRKPPARRASMAAAQKAASELFPGLEGAALLAAQMKMSRVGVLLKARNKQFSATASRVREVSKVLGSAVVAATPKLDAFSLLTIGACCQLAFEGQKETDPRDMSPARKSFALCAAANELREAMKAAAMPLADKLFTGKDGDSLQELFLMCAVGERSDSEPPLGSAAFNESLLAAGYRLESLARLENSVSGFGQRKITLRAGYDALLAVRQEMGGTTLGEQDLPRVFVEFAKRNPALAELLFDAMPGDVSWGQAVAPKAEASKAKAPKGKG